MNIMKNQINCKAEEKISHHRYGEDCNILPALSLGYLSRRQLVYKHQHFSALHVRQYAKMNDSKDYLEPL